MALFSNKSWGFDASRRLAKGVHVLVFGSFNCCIILNFNYFVLLIQGNKKRTQLRVCDWRFEWLSLFWIVNFIC